ncbi:MAG: hypothetical protein MMC33_001640 [Icmadophila ericetorum]|nr:hypothetical protein [Icmadophila ericetorum]
MSAYNQESPPSSILIVGAGVFGLSTALALLCNPKYKSTTVTLLDNQTPRPGDATIPKNPLTASIDSSRIIRADYASPLYASLANKAQKLWRQGWGGENNYHETGLLLDADDPDTDGGKGKRYVVNSVGNVRKLEKEWGLGVYRKPAEELKSHEEIKQVMLGTEGDSGVLGYINWGSGWADAEAAVEHIRVRVALLGQQREREGGAPFNWRIARVKRLIFDEEVTDIKTSSSLNHVSNGTIMHPSPRTIRTVNGVHVTGLAEETTLSATLTILATGAWTPDILDTRHQLRATGQILAYLTLTDEEASTLRETPVMLNMSTGLFIIPPSPTANILKIARHGYGYSNPTQIPNPDVDSTQDLQGDLYVPSLPPSNPDHMAQIPPEGHAALRAYLSTLIPSLATRVFTAARTCWYTDTLTGDFLISYHPRYHNLFLATGGSGHGFKFFPVIGEEVIKGIEGTLEPEWVTVWSWKDGVREEGEEREEMWETEDGSRGGPKGLVWKEEMDK